MFDDDDSLIKDFVFETRDMLDDAELRLIEMQRAPADVADSEVIHSVFRLFHSIKGSAGFLNFNNISSVAHETETLLDLFRKGKAVFTPGFTDLLCHACDFIRRVLEKIEKELTDTGMEDATSALVKSLAAGVAEAKAGSLSGSAAPASSTPKTPAPEPPPPQPAPPKPPVETSMPTPQTAAAPPPTSLQAIITPDMLELFFQDAGELLEEAEQHLLQLSRQPDHPRNMVDAIFRAIHTLKGNSGFFGYPDIETLSHRVETVLDFMREEKIEITDSNVQILINMVDILKNGIASLAREGQTGIQNLETMLQLLDELIPTEPEQAAEVAPLHEQTPAPAQNEQPSPAPSAPPAPQPPAKAKSASAPPASTKAVVRQDIRVDVEKLDHLHNLVGEMVIATAMVTMNTDLKGLSLENFSRAAHQLSLIVSELQDTSMSLRMIPIAGTFRKMIRLCHDLGRRSGKKVETRLIGEETEIDKGVAELIADPLVHLVRNAVDHGLEPPAARLKAGKPEAGIITLEARHQSGEIWIAIRDDGRGLNREAVIAKGLERGLVRGDPSNLTDSDVFNLIFEPGFSTAETITDVSGRGVGMDVVRKNIEKLRGRIDVENNPGHGLSINLRIPLTLAIIQGMLVRAGKETYIAPLLSIKESFRAAPGAITTVSGRGEMIQVRGELLPFFRLARLYDVPEAMDDPMHGITMILEEGNHQAAVMVDEIIGQQEIVIKSLGELFGTVPGVSGSSILSDGKVGLILDVAGLIRLATG